MWGRRTLIPSHWALFGMLGCGTTGTPPVQPGDPGVPVGNAGGAAITAAAAGVVWAVGGGCRLQGCPYGTFCNGTSGFCVVKKCSEGCPSGTICNEGLDRCQAAPPPQTPNDFLPQDDRTRIQPGMRH